jgi:hypothetical protein
VHLAAVAGALPLSQSSSWPSVRLRKLLTAFTLNRRMRARGPRSENWDAAGRFDPYPPREHRHQVDLCATVMRFALPEVRVRIRNISLRGAHGETGELMCIGSTVMIDLPELGEVGAHVRWSLGSRFGLRFLGADEQPLRGQLSSYLCSLAPNNGRFVVAGSGTDLGRRRAQGEFAQVARAKG